MPLAVTVTEVGPRDGLQNESVRISTADKIAFIDRLSAAKLSEIEVTAFVSARRVPQMEDAEAVFTGITKRAGTLYSALVPNMAGYERAVEAGVTNFAIFAAASEAFSERNLNKSIDESLDEYKLVAAAVAKAGFRLRAYLSTAFGCPFEGDVPVERVEAITRRLLDLGAFEVAVSDTIGVANPDQVKGLLPQLLDTIPPASIALHFHDTRGNALANIRAALDFGIKTFDASAGGLGGCPFAPGATGNVATEDVLEMLHGLGIETGVDINAVSDAVLALAPQLGHPLSSRYTLAR
ncbi:MAG: hydroxymethylglutaryl-CoA lyase [Vicinamibacterales bacterium]